MSSFLWSTCDAVLILSNMNVFQICIVREHSEVDGTVEYVMGCEKRMVG